MSTAPATTPSVIDVIRRPRVLLREVLAGLVTSLALIPEATAFAIVAGLDPRMGLFGSVVVALVTSVLGGRPGMVSAAAGSVALVAAPLVSRHGTEAFLAAVVLSGAIQLVLAAAGAVRLLRFVPPAVMKGFVNALAILIFLSQLPQLVDVPWAVYPLVGLGLLVVVLLPRLTTAVPAPLVAIAVVSGAAVLAGVRVPTVGDQGALPEGLPLPRMPDVAWSADLLLAVLPIAAAMAVVGLVESLLTARLVDQITRTPSSPGREAWGLGVANVVSGFLGCMGGCAMIGQTMINVRSGGARSRVSTLAAGGFVLLLALAVPGLLAAIPMAALVAVMVYVSVTTADWHSLAPGTLRRQPVAETAIMAVTVVITVLTRDLALGVVLGALAAQAVIRLRGRAAPTMQTGAPDSGPGPEPKQESGRGGSAPD